MRRKGSLGKLDRRYLQRVIFNSLGATRREIIIGPKLGVDNAVIRAGPGKVWVLTTDPLSYIPRLGAADSAWLSVNLLASDLTTSALAPQFGVFDFNLPPNMADEKFANYWRAFSNECKKMGVAIVAGHTGRYQGCDYSIIGGGVMASIGPEEQYLASTMARDTDDIILTKGAAIETTAVLSRAFPKTVRKAIGRELFELATQYLAKVSTVNDALTSASAGLHEDGVTAMHDATEGGIISAVQELASASGLGAEIDLDKIMISEETRQICKFFRIDPMTSLSEGSLLVASRPNKTGNILRRLGSKGIHSRVIGQLISRTRGCFGVDRRGRHRLCYPQSDPYWKAYSKGVTRRWK